jgi:hypothetical protein
MDPAIPYKTTLATVGAGRAAAVAQLRSLADRIEQLALTDVAEVLILLEPVLDDLRPGDARARACPWRQLISWANNRHLLANLVESATMQEAEAR